MASKISSLRGIKPGHKDAILKEATRLNGSAASNKGLAKLRTFAEKMCGSAVDEKVLRHILRPPPERRGHRPELRSGSFICATH